MEEKHGDELVTDLTHLVDNSQTISDQGVTSGLDFMGDIDEDDFPRPSGTAIIGELLYGRYRIISLIAKGGMGEVYKAKMETGTTEKFVAVKVLSERYAERKESLYRFMREVGSITVLKHPNLVAVSDIGLLANGCPYYVMEYIEGKSLADILSAEGKMETERARRMFVQLAGALAVAHERGIVHRDIKPSNILVHRDSEGEQIKLVDFGIAKREVDHDEIQKLTAQGTVFGSPLYMSPEQCEGRSTDARSDVYSTCCTLYECLKGQPPFLGETPLQTMGMHRSDTPPPLGLTGLDGFLIESAIMKGLSKKPEERFQDAKELLDCLVSQMPAQSPAASSKPAEQEKQDQKIKLDEKPVQLASTVTLVIIILLAAAALVFFLVQQGHK